MATHTDYTNQDSGNARYMDVLFDISADDDLTGSIDLQDFTLVGIVMPAAWTAADITLEGSVDDTTFNAINAKNGTTYTITAAASQFIAIPVADSFPFPRYLKLASSAAQLADRTLTLLIKR
jgi:hypothetical protein